MASYDSHYPQGGDVPAWLARIFAWGMFATLFCFLINNFLNSSYRWPGAAAALRGGGDAVAWGQLGLYPLGWLLAIGYVITFGDRTLRADSDTISAISAFLVRAAYWMVVFIGIADATISFLRVEGFLDQLIGHQLSTDLGRSQFRGPYVHIPLMFLGVLAAAVTRTLGFLWLSLLIVVAELAIVLTRFVFSYEQAFMGDLVRFWYAALFLFASAYTLIEEGHVRVDIFYTGFSDPVKGYVNAFGSIFLGISLCWTILLIGMSGNTAIINSPMLNYEVTQSGFGMYVKYLMAGFLGVFAVTMMIQFISYFLAAIADIREEPGKYVPASPAAH